ncbi:hypothetical protein OR214_02089 [Ralstonia pickettii OR214]|jgi:hypothetical protein|uniref:Uncharacterized protein n=2 Tax=Ralstonia pickettii TaxID=329 RepID=R0DWK6_RALPI|nr:hypothetical protein OR214_02089 [Ralstonia pickettii OR214]
MAFEELDARVIGSSITVRLEEYVGGAPVRPPSQTRVPPARTTPPGVSTLPPAPKPEAKLVKPEEGSGQTRSVAAKSGRRKGGGLFVMKPLSAERLRVALAVGCFGAIALGAGSIYVRDGWSFFKGFLPTAHVEKKIPASLSAPQNTVAAGPVTTAVSPAPVAPPASAVVVPQAAAVVAPTQPTASVEVHNQTPPTQPVVAAPVVLQQASAPVAAAAPVVVETQPIRKVEVQPVPQALIERAPVLPLPAAPKIARPRVVRQEAPTRPQPHEAPAAEQNSPILVGGQFSKGKDSK